MEGSNSFSYVGYQEMIADITAAVEKIREVMEGLGLNERSEQAKEAVDRLKSHVFSVGIMGEFKRGKSTVINALLGEEVAPSDVLPASATLNRITYGFKPKATIVYKDGHQEEVPVDNIANYITKITEESAQNASLVEQAIVEYPCQFCQNNVEIIDTPGLNDDERMQSITESVIPSLDAVVMVLSAGAPFSMSEAEFVRNKLMTSDVTRMIVLVNRMDTVFLEKDKKRILDEIKGRITEKILERTASIHGTDSKLYAETENKVAGVQVYPLSAIQALVGRKENNPELVEKSGILKFEERLRKLLTEERGILEITRVANVINTLLAEGVSTIDVCVSTLEMDAKEFDKNKEAAEKEIMELRESKKHELERIRNTGEEIKEQIDAFIQEKYADLEEVLENYALNYDVDPKALKSENTRNEIERQFQEGLQKEAINALSDYTEQINVLLQEKIGDESVQIQQYIGEFAERYIRIDEQLKSGTAATLGTIGIDAISNLVAASFTGILTGGGFGLMGLGGLIEGYRANGAKGAATGILGGFAAGSATAVGLIMAMGTVPFLPFALLTGIAGTLGGRLLTTTIWKKDIAEKKIQKMRETLKKEVEETVRGLKSQGLLEDWAEKQVRDQIDALIRQVEKETESMITNTEITLKNIATDRSASEKDREKKLEQYKNMEDTLRQVNEILAPIMQKVASAVNATE